MPTANQLYFVFSFTTQPVSNYSRNINEKVRSSFYIIDATDSSFSKKTGWETQEEAPQCFNASDSELKPHTAERSGCPKLNYFETNDFKHIRTSACKCTHACENINML